MVRRAPPRPADLRRPPGHVRSVGSRPRAVRGRKAVLAAVAVLAACGGPVEPEVRRLLIVPEVGLVVGPSGTERFRAVALGPAGSVSTHLVSWSVADPSVATIDAMGRASAVSVGTTTVTAELGGVTATAEVEVWLPDPVDEYLSGQSYFGRNGYVEYIPGELPVILSAPHGGDLTPHEIPPRTFGESVRDRNTLELTLAVRDALVDLTGYAPYLVLSHLDRSRLDPNREIDEAAEENPFAERAWTEYHGFIERARGMLGVRGEGMYFDIHGHGHPIPRVELGYLLPADRLDLPDINLDQLSVVQLTSIREIGRDSPIPFSSLLRGPTSFGGLLEAEGVPAVPSPTYPSPGSDPYFSGGYSTRRHGSIGDTELISGIQLEHHFTGLRDTEENRAAYAEILARVIRDFMLEHIGYFEPD